jgi:serine/threonine-protein kinase
MAEIYLATAQGVEGFAKDVVIKVVRSFLSTDQQFVQMFIAEARLASRLNHANIVQIFDFGRHDERYFLAMEYVRGASLWELRKRCRELGVPFPPTLAAEICTQVACGLQYAHSLSEGGRRLGVVHRDVTPHNVLLSFDGAVKLTDFGIAKATTSQTAPGMLKGKFAYMSPEQSRGEKVDARSDLFALGIVLWEMLTGGRLFDGDSDVAILRAVQDSLIAPPTRLNPDVPQQLSDVVMKLLSRRVEERFQTAFEAERALATFVLNHAQTVEETSVAQFVQEMFREEYELGGDQTLDPADEPLPPGDNFGVGDTLFLNRGKEALPTMTQTPASTLRARATPKPIKLSQLAEPAELRKTTPLPPAATDFGPGSPARRTEPLPMPGRRRTEQMGPKRSGSSSQRFGRIPAPNPSGQLEGVETIPPAGRPNQAEEEPLAPPPRGRAVLVAGGLAAIAIAVGAITLALWPSPPEAPVSVAAAEPEPESPPVPKRAIPAGGQQPAGPRPVDAAPVDAAPVDAPPVDAPPVDAAPVDAAPVDVEPPESPAESPASDPRRPTTTRAATAPRMGRLTVKAMPYAVVNENGRLLGEVMGSQSFQLRAGPHELELVHPQKRKRQNVTIRPGEETRVDFNALD